jgi:hypothetical protein
MRRREILPALLGGVGISLLSLAHTASAGPFAIVSQSVKPNFVDQTLSFRLEFDEPPDFAALDENGKPVQNIAYDITTDAGSGTLVDFDRAIRRSTGNLSVEAFDRDAEGNLGNPRGPISLNVDGNVVTFTSTFNTINDADGKFLYRVIATENGEVVSQAVGATIPLPAGVWVGLVGLTAIAGRRSLLPLSRHQ